MGRPLEEIQDELLDAVHAGEAIDRDAVLAAHPEHAQDLGAFLDLLEVVEGHGEDHVLPPSTLGEYRIVREIGRGGMGIVYEAEQTSLKRAVALKVLPPSLRMDTRLVSRFRKEAEAAGRLSHPGIVPVFAVGEAAGAPFFAMEYVPGRTLREIIRLRKDGASADLPREQDAWRRWAVETCARVGDALAYAHGEGILHRDVKPGNILINGDDVPRLTDFGLARDLRSPGLSLTGEVLGSPQYMSPEQAVRQEFPVDERTDIYSLAVTLYQLITLELPYPAATHAELLTALAAGRVVPPREVDPGIPRPLEQVLLRALRKDPRERYGDAASFAADLRAAIDGRAPAFAGAPRRRGLVWGLAAAAVVAGVLLFLAGPDDDPAPRDPETAALPEGGAPVDPAPADPVPEDPVPEDPAPADPVPEDPAASDPETGKAAAEDPDPVATMVQETLARYEAAAPTDAAGFLSFLEPLRGLMKTGAFSEADRARIRSARERIARDFVAGPGAMDDTARAFLGHRKFEREIPEAVTNRNHDFLRAVAWAAKKRWFAPDEFELHGIAEQAWAETERHLEKLVHDEEFNRGDRAAPMLQLDRHLEGYLITTRFVSPFLLGYVSDEPCSLFDAVARHGSGKRPDLETLRARSAEASRALDEQARLLTQLHAEYRRRYGDTLGLRSLMAPYGGRPDYQGAMRSFRDGVPLVVLYFATADLFQAFHKKSQGPLVPHNVAGYFNPRTTFVYLHAPRGAATDFARLKTLHEGTHQLEWWYYRQRNAWRKPRPTQAWFEEGFADHMGAGDVAEDGTVTFHGVNEPRLASMQTMAKRLRSQGRAYPMFPIRKLTGFTSLRSAMQWATQTWQLNPQLGLMLYYQQSWALTYYLERKAKAEWRKAFATFHELRMSGEDGAQAFATAFRLRDEDDWEALDDAFRAFVADDLMKRPLR